MSMFRNLMMRKTVPGFVGGWKSYGRSNAEDPSTRDILPDYSGNGRDIKLYNFAFAGMSGWNGFRKDWDTWLDVYTGNGGHNYLEGDTLHILEVSPWANTLSDVVSGEEVSLKIRVQGLTASIANNEVNDLQLYFNVSSVDSQLSIKEDGDYDVSLTAPEGATKFFILVKTKDTVTGWIPLSIPVTIEQLPSYPGGLVSDGVDDYGQCLKGFVLPDDYTILAVRKRIINSGYIATKTNSLTEGAFIFEGGNDTYSYGRGTTPLPDKPTLFSWQSKNSYNGVKITPGSGSDTNDLMILRNFTSGSLFLKAVLYDLRIYDHSLTEGELRRVRKEMLWEYGRETGNPIDNI